MKCNKRNNKITFSKYERKIIYYVAMLHIVTCGLDEKGICWSIYLVLNDILLDVTMFSINLHDFPELIKQKPAHRYSKDYWYHPGKCKSKRLQALSNAIALC